MKKKLIGAMLVFTVLGMGIAMAQRGHKSQGDKNSEMRMEKKVEKLAKELELTSEQQLEVTAIFAESQKEMEAIQENHPSLKAAKEEMKELQKENKSRMKEILTEEQQQMMKENHKGKSQKGHPHGKQKKEDEDLSNMKEKLNISDEQVNEMKELSQEMKGKKEEIQKKYPELKEAKTEMKEVQKHADEKMKGVLSSEQFEKYVSMKKERIKKSHQHTIKGH